MEIIQIVYLSALAGIWLVAFSIFLRAYLTHHSKLFEASVMYALNATFASVLASLAALFAKLMHYLLT